MVMYVAAVLCSFFGPFYVVFWVHYAISNV